MAGQASILLPKGLLMTVVEIRNESQLDIVVPETKEYVDDGR